MEYLNSLTYVPTLREVSEATGLSVSSVWRIVKQLEGFGIGFKAVPLLSRLGLTEVLLVYYTRIPARKVPEVMLRSFIRTLEGVTLLRYVSRRHEVEIVVNHVVDRVGVEPSEVYVLDTIIAPKYVLTHIARGVMDRVYVRELLALASTYQQPAAHAVGTCDVIDIALVNLLEENAFVKIKEVLNYLRAMSVSVSYRTVLKHYHNHIVGRGVIAGIRPTVERYVERLSPSTRRVLLVYGVPHSVGRAMKAVLGLPLFSEALLSSKEGVAVAISTTPMEVLPRVVEFLDLLSSRGYISEWRLLEVDPSSQLKRPLPEALGSLSTTEIIGGRDSVSS
jgi:DNA-binding Lrp family transcriptional regulator